MRMVLSMVMGSLLLPALAAAQQARPARGTMVGASPGARVFAAAPSMRGGPVHRMQTTGAEFSSFQTFPTFSVQTVSFDNVPGLGFDFPHLAAVTRGQPRHRSILEPIGFSGIFLSPLVEPPTVVIVQQPPAVEVLEYPATASSGESLRDNDSDSVPVRVPARRESTPARAARQPETPPPEPAPAAQQDSAQYVFVQRDGSLLFAVAYSWEKGMLRYITPEGLRRSVGRDKLDLDATQQFNEQRGLVFRSPV